MLEAFGRLLATVGKILVIVARLNRAIGNSIEEVDIRRTLNCNCMASMHRSTSPVCSSN